MGVAESREVAVGRSIPIARDGHRRAGRYAAHSDVLWAACDVCALQVLCIAQIRPVILIEIVIDAKRELWFDIEHGSILSKVAGDQGIGSRGWLRHKLAVERSYWRHLGCRNRVVR